MLRLESVSVVDLLRCGLLLFYWAAAFVAIDALFKELFSLRNSLTGGLHFSG